MGSGWLESDRVSNRVEWIELSARLGWQIESTKGAMGGPLDGIRSEREPRKNLHYYFGPGVENFRHI